MHSLDHHQLHTKETQRTLDLLDLDFGKLDASPPWTRGRIVVIRRVCELAPNQHEYFHTNLGIDCTHWVISMSYVHYKLTKVERADLDRYLKNLSFKFAQVVCQARMGQKMHSECEPNPSLRNFWVSQNECNFNHVSPLFFVYMYVCMYVCVVGDAHLHCIIFIVGCLAIIMFVVFLFVSN